MERYNAIDSDSTRKAGSRVGEFMKRTNGTTGVNVTKGPPFRPLCGRETYLLRVPT